MVRFALALLCLLCLPAAAQTPPPPAVPAPPAEELAAVEGPARLTLWLDPVRRNHSAALEAGATTQVHLVAVGAEGGINAWEARLLLDPRLDLVGVDLAGGIDLGREAGSYRVGLGRTCRVGQEVVLATFTVLSPEGGDDLVLGVGAVDQGSFDPPAPGYLGCASLDDLFPFQTADTLAVLNPVAVQLPETTPSFPMERAGGGGR